MSENNVNEFNNEDKIIETNVSAVSNETGDLFITSPEIEGSSVDSNNADNDIDPIVVLNIKPNRFKRAISKLNGFMTFALILAISIILIVTFSAGYFVGQNSLHNASKVALEERPTGETLTTSEVYQKVNPSIVGIIIYNAEGEGSMASGVIYTKDGYIITNDHIYSGIKNAKFKIYTYDGQEYEASYVAGDARSDLAVLKANANNLKPAEFGNSDSCIVGEGAVAIGRPAGAKVESTISKGIISGLNVRVRSASTSYSEKFIQTDAAINPGSSGGALCNMYGQVIGVTSSKLMSTMYERVGYAIPTVRMKTIVDSLIKNKNVLTRAKAGISYTEIESVISELNDMPEGLYVASVDKESKFYGKLKEGDIIVAINDTPATAESVLDVIESSKPGDSVEFTIYRPDSGKTFDVIGQLLADKGTSSYKTK